MGKISKPQKSNKHKKLKSIDPFYVGERPSDRHEGKYNLNPKKLDDWENSRSIQEIVRLKNEGKISKTKQNPRKKNKFKARDAEGILDNLGDNEHGITRPLPRLPQFKQRKGESEQKFLWRVDRETQAVINRAHFEDKFHIGEDPELFKSNPGKKKKGIKRNADTKDDKEDKIRAKAKKKERLMVKKKKIEEKKRNKTEDRYGGFSALRDDIKFGEVVQQPPTLTVKPRKAADCNSTSKIGTTRLLLHSLLEDQPDQSNDDDIVEPPSVQKHERKEREIGKTIKRKHLSAAEQRIMDSEREKAIESYRKMKQKQFILPVFTD